MEPEPADSHLAAKLGNNKDTTAASPKAAGHSELMAEADVVPEKAEVKEEEIEPIPYFTLFSKSDNVDKAVMVLAALSSAGEGAALPLFSIFFGDFTDIFGGFFTGASEKEFMDGVIKLSLKFLYLGIGAAITALLGNALWMWVGNRQTNRLRRLYLASILRQDIEYFDVHVTTGGLLQGLNQDAIDVQAGISEKVGLTIKSLSTFFTGFVVAFIFGWDMTLVLLGCVPFMSVLGSQIAGTIARATAAQNAAYAEASNIAQQAIAQVRTVVSYAREDAMHKRYSASLDLPLRSGVRQSWLMGLAFGGFQIIIYGAFAIALIYGAWRIVEGEYSGGDVMSVLFSVLMGAFAIGQAAPNIQYIIRAKTAGARLLRVIDRAPLVHDAPDAVEPGKVIGELQLEGVTFAYPARPEVVIFRNLSLTMAAGKTTALVGSSGSGKSTVVSLVERFYDPLEGRVTLDGMDLRQIKLRWLRDQVGLVSQEPVLFAASIYENVLLGRASATPEEVEAACIAANAHGFIMQQPDGYNTSVGERGLKLSGGQKQRIAIARAILKNPRILLLDEATSALDTQSERLVQAALDHMVVGRTTVVVAHRLSTIKNADMIAVLQGGVMVEQGSHDQLLANPQGAYANLVALQMQTTILEAEADKKGGDASAPGEAAGSSHDGSSLPSTEELAAAAAAAKLAAATSDEERFAAAAALAAATGGVNPAALLGGAAGALGSAPPSSGPHGGVDIESGVGVGTPAAGSAAAAAAALAERGSGPASSKALEVAPGSGNGRQQQQQQGPSSGDVAGGPKSGPTAVLSQLGAVVKRVSVDAFRRNSVGGPNSGGLAVPQAAMVASPGNANTVVMQTVNNIAQHSAMGTPHALGKGSGGKHQAQQYDRASAAAAASMLSIASMHRENRKHGKSFLRSLSSRRHSNVLSGHSHSGRHDGKNTQEQREEEEEAHTDTSFKRLAHLNKPEWKLGVLGCFGSGVAGAMSPAFAFLFSSMVGIFYTPDHDKLWREASMYAGLIAMVGFAGALAIGVQQGCFGTMGQHLARRVRELLFAAYLRQEIAWFDRSENSSGVLSTMLSTDASHVRGAVGDIIGLTIQNIITLASGYVIALIFDWRMALLVTGIMPLLLFAQVVQTRYMMGTTGAGDKIFASSNQSASEAITSIRVVTSYNMQQAIQDKYKHLILDVNTEITKSSISSGLAAGVSAFTMFSTYSLIIYFGGHEIKNGWVNFTDMLRAYMAVVFAAMGLAQASAGFGDIGKAKGAVNRVFPVVDRKPKIDSSDPSGLTPPPSSIHGDIAFENVLFAYPTRMAVTIFRDFSLEVKGGQMVALVGESGSGKSTVVGLIERFYDPQAGRVTLDGIDVRDYNLRWLRSQIGLVSQEPLLFSGSILDNIVFSNPDASMEEVEAAAAAANARGFIDALPEGYQTKVGEGGIQLSGGQKQRVAIARAVLKNPRIMLLDEATSALDARSEAVVQDALDRIMVGRTSIVIAHRLSTVRNADKIAVVYRGKILEQGTHGELMAASGAYSRLVAAQTGAAAPAHAAKH